MATQMRWMMAAALAASLGACKSDDDPPADTGTQGLGAMTMEMERANPDDPSPQSPGEDGDGPEPSETPTGSAGTDAPLEPLPGEDPPANAVCEADPHHADCVDTHVRGQCGINSGYPGDEACLLAPPAGEGIQIHIGPSDYTDPAAVAPFIFEPGMESSECWFLETPNDEDIHYQGWTLSGRPGTHHIINTGFTTPNTAGGAFQRCRFADASQITGRIPGASKPYMPRFAVAPENEGLGYPLAAHTPMQSDMHYFNYTDEPILREYWLNMYAVPSDQVTTTPNRIRGYGGISYNITPGTNMVYNYSCPINGDGRITALLGHTHSHTIRFTAWVNRTASGERQKVFEAFDYLEPQIYAYNTVEVNPEFSESAPGAVSGVLNVAAGDTMEWECHVINDSDVTLRFTNFVDTGEMCNIWGETVGPVIDCNR
jgi:hypothetical protein